MQYLSREWLQAVGRRLADDPGLARVSEDVALTLEQVVTDGPSGTVRWHVVLDHGRVQLIEGPSPTPDLRFTASYPTASAIAAGRLSAQQAFTEGRLRVGGDVSLLVTHHRTLASLDDVLAPVRARTTHPATADGG